MGRSRILVEKSDSRPWSCTTWSWETWCLRFAGGLIPADNVSWFVPMATPARTRWTKALITAIKTNLILNLNLNLSNMRKHPMIVMASGACLIKKKLVYMLAEKCAHITYGSHQKTPVRRNIQLVPSVHPSIHPSIHLPNAAVLTQTD
jgi:hypothetical protein